MRTRSSFWLFFAVAAAIGCSSTSTDGSQSGSGLGAGPGTDSGSGSDSGSDATSRSDARAGTDSGSPSACDGASLVWHTANKTNYESYPAPGSPECVQYNGCAYEGQFAACSQTETKDWVAAHNIVSVFPNLNRASNGIPALALHDLCLKSGSKTILVTVLDECADSDCSGCCTQNKGSAEELIDVESFTNARWGVDDGPIQWADLGPTKGSGCK